MKKLAYIAVASLSITGISFADDTFVMDTATLREETLSKAHEKISNYFELMDIDDNGKLSANECAGTGEGFENIPMFSQKELTDLKTKIDNAFPRFDKDGDKYLDKEEAQAYFTYIENLAMDTQIAKMDINGDGNITDDEMMQLMKNMPSIEESMAKLQETTKKLEEINKNPQEFTDQIVKNTGLAVAKEESLQMDADNNNKITQEEYINYMFNHPNNKELGFSEDDYKGIYSLIDEKNKGFITTQEYQEYQKQELQKVLEDISSAEE